MVKRSYIFNYSVYVIILILSYFSFFHRLGVEGIHLWDESRVIANALEMYKNGKILLTFFEGEIDTWNTKPPLMVICQVLSFRVFGINEFAARFPSALAGFLIVLIVFFYIKKQYGGYVFPAISAIAIILCPGFITRHIARTGDYDALLTFWTTSAFILFDRYCNLVNTKKINLYIYLIMLAFLFGFFTKSIQAIIFLPAFFLICIASPNNIISLLKNKHLYLSLLLFVFIVSGYFIYRELNYPGYLQYVLYNDIIGRYTERLVSPKPLFFYLIIAYKNNFLLWYIIVPVSLYFSFYEKSLFTRRFIRRVLFVFVFYFIVITISKSKGLQYAAPLFPLGSILIGYSVYWIYHYIFSIYITSKSVKLFFTVCIIIGVFLLPFMSLKKEIFIRKKRSHKERFGHFITKELKDTKLPKVTYIINDGYNTHLLFYIQRNNMTQCNKLKTRPIADSASFTKHDYIIISGKEYYDEFKRNYDLKVLKLNNECFLFKILSKISKE